MASVFWNVTAPGTIFVVLSIGPLVETVPVPKKKRIRQYYFPKKLIINKN